MVQRFRTVCYRGDYATRLDHANRDRAICYVEHHFNSSKREHAAYACSLISSNAPPVTIRWASTYCRFLSAVFGIPLKNGVGVVSLTVGDRGYTNIADARMPAMLIEPLFVSNVSHSKVVRSSHGRELLAKVLVDSIVAVFPNGGLVGLSVGHKYRDSRPNDRGAAVVGGGTEADFAELVLGIATEMLQAAT